MGTLVYKYGLRPPVESAALVDEQMRLAHRYQNRLIEIEQVRRTAVRAVLAKRDEQLGPQMHAVEAVKATLEEAIAKIKDTRKATRSRSDTAEQRAHVSALRDRKREVLATLKEARDALKMDESDKAALAVAEDEAHKALREARSVCGVYWGTYLQIEAAMDAARKAPLWDHGEPSDPKFRRWDGEGLVAVQVQTTRPLPALSLLAGTDTRVQVALDPLSDNPSKTQAKKRRGLLRLRVGSEGPGNKTPIWAAWPILMHRPLPPEAIITWAKVVRRMTANHDRWELHLSLSMPDGVKRGFGAGNRPEVQGSGAVFINFGWRQLDDGGRRVAYWRDKTGAEDQITMDLAVLSGLRKVEDLQAIRDKALNEMRGRFSDWLRTVGDALPAWLREEAAYLYEWKSPGRFVALRRHWDEQRFDGDEQVFALLTAWERGVWREDLGRMDGGDRHLWQWQEHQRRKSLARRKDHYRCIAADLARRYAVLVIEDFDLRKTQRHIAPESEEAEIAAARLQQKDAAISELRGCMIQAFDARGGKVVKVDPRLDTQRCHLCGHEERWDPIPRIDHTCKSCGQIWDQDANATWNIERKFRERPNDDGEPPTKSLAKWAKRGRHTGTARKVADNSAKPLDA